MKLQDISLFESYSTAKQVFGRDASPEEVSKRLEQFKQLNQRNMLKPEEKDLGKWIRAGWQSFSSFVADASGRTSGKAEKKAKRGDSIRVYENNNWLVVIPLSKDASCFYGKGTQWCTAASASRNYFEDYFHNSNITLLYCISKSSGEKLAAAFSEKTGEWECFNAEDKSISINDVADAVGVDTDEMAEWVQEHEGETGSVRADFGSVKVDTLVKDALLRLEEKTVKAHKLSDAIDNIPKGNKDPLNSWYGALKRLESEALSVNHTLGVQINDYKQAGNDRMVAFASNAFKTVFLPKYKEFTDVVGSMRSKLDSIESDGLLSALGV